MVTEARSSGEETPIGRFFTPEEANAMLPDVRDRLARAVHGAEELRSIARRAQSEGALEGDELRRASRLRDEVSGILDELRSRGVEVKGLDTGLIDFPAMRNGRFVYLCWRSGDPVVEWWHPVHTGYAGRQRVTHGDGVSWEWRN